jgi:hypothetical protein
MVCALGGAVVRLATGSDFTRDGSVVDGEATGRGFSGCGVVVVVVGVATIKRRPTRELNVLVIRQVAFLAFAGRRL